MRRDASRAAMWRRGCIVRTTAEILLALLPEHGFSREPDAESGCNELVIRPVAPPRDA